MKLFGRDKAKDSGIGSLADFDDLPNVDTTSVPDSLVDWYLNPDAPSPVNEAPSTTEAPPPPSPTDQPAQPTERPPARPTGPTVDEFDMAGAVLPEMQEALAEPLAPASEEVARLETQPLPTELLELKDDAQRTLGERLGQSLYESALSDAELEARVIQELADYLNEQDTSAFTAEQLESLGSAIVNDILGHGPIEPFLEDESVTEIMVNGPDHIFVERAGKLVLSQVKFDSDAHVRRVIDRIVSRIGRRVDESSPMVDARLPDGSRVNAIIPPLAIDGSSITIRKFAKRALDETDLVNYGSLSWESVAVLRAFVKGRLNILISGGTGSGKTTLLNVCSNFIPSGERIVTIEDAAELRLAQPHVVRLESRPPNIEGKGAVPIRDLVKNSLRMRPDRIVIGECRGGEALDMLQAMNTGHEGSLSTLHANNPRDTISRLETLVLMAGMDLPVRAIREQISSAVDVIVQLTRLRDGTRRVTYITEVVGMEGDTITLSDIFTYEYDGFDSEGRYIGELRPTGLRPMVIEKLQEHGIELPASTFGDASAAADFDFTQ